MEKQCSNLLCGSTFYKPKQLSNFNWNKQKYCSRKCGIAMTTFKKGNQVNLGRKRPDMTGENSFKWKPKISKVCKQCKEPFQVAPNEKDKKFCKADCYYLWHRGENSPVWKGDKAVNKIRERIRGWMIYINWRKAALERDGYKCTECPSTHLLEVHHLKPFAQIIIENNIKTPEEARICEELWNIDNAQTLCRSCHRATDKHTVLRSESASMAVAG